MAYSWSLIGDRSRDAVGFRGFSAKFPAAAPAREVMDFTVQGPLIACLADLQDVTQLQAIDMGAAIAAIAANSGQALILGLMFDNSDGDINATISTPIGTVTVNKPFTAAPGLVGLDG